MCTQMDYNGVDSVKITQPFSDKMDFKDALLCMAAHYKEGAHCLKLEELFEKGADGNSILFTRLGELQAEIKSL